MAIASINPATGETLRTFEPLTDAEIKKKIDLASKTFRVYRHTTFTERARMMTRAAEILEAEKDKFASIMTTEMGKPLRAAVEEAVKCAAGCRYYAETAERALADEVIVTNATRSFVPPLRYVTAPYPTFNGVAIDIENNRVVMSDENRKSVLTYDRAAGNNSTNVTAPLRQIIGPKTEIGYISGVEVDQARRELYAVNNASEAR